MDHKILYSYLTILCVPFSIFEFYPIRSYSKIQVSYFIFLDFMDHNFIPLPISSIKTISDNGFLNLGVNAFSLSLLGNT